MNLGTLLQKAYDLIAAARAGNWIIAIGLALEIIRALADVLPPASLGKPAMHSTGSVNYEAMDIDDLLTALEDCCNAPPVAAPGVALTAADPQVTGPFITLMLPIVLALLKKLLGW